MNEKKLKKILWLIEEEEGDIDTIKQKEKS